MAAAAGAASVSLRPHAKTHKSDRIARLQLDAGARGLSLAKTGEAEVFAARGFTDLFLAYPVIGAAKARRLLDVAERATLSVGVDSVAGAESLAATFAAARPRSRRGHQGRLRLPPRRRPAARRAGTGARARRTAGPAPQGNLHPRRSRLLRRDPGGRGAGGSGGRRRDGEGGGRAARRRHRGRAPCRLARRRPRVPRCAPAASTNAVPATTSTTTPRRWRSARAASKTAR